jgi:hypothetical protein
MYEGGLEQFNSIVRNELKADVMHAIRATPHTVLPYSVLMTGLIASVGFMFFGSSWFRDSNQETFVCFTMYMVTFTWVMIPVIAALSLWQGERMYLKGLEEEREGAGGEREGIVAAMKRLKWKFLLIGAKGAVIFIHLWTSLAFVLPLASANAPEREKFLGLFGKSAAVWLSTAACAPCWGLAWWMFTKSGKGLRSGAQVVDEHE